MAPRITLPLPPTDLPSRKLPLVTVKGPLYRIHRTVHYWRHFGKNASERFDDPMKQYGVLYVSTQTEAAFAEVFLRTLSLMVVDEVDLRSRSLASFAANSLRCVESDWFRASETVVRQSNLHGKALYDSRIMVSGTLHSSSTARRYYLPEPS